MKNNDPADESFGPVIYSYSRAEALDDGQQIDVSHVAREAGIVLPVFLTRALWEKYVEVPKGSTEDEVSRLWDILWMLRCAAFKAPRGSRMITYHLIIGPQWVGLKAVCGALDIDKPEPAITIMLPHED